ncbi:MAG: hypothetical protein KIS91_04620 [Anaerolineae bacterium]|nr:hypothetical protein [Anaerolineae bacterium]
MTRSVSDEQISLLPPDAAALLHLVRENLRLLAEISQRYEVATMPATTERRTIRTPADVADYLGPEMVDLAQEQLRVILLDTKHHVLGTRLVYQGGVNAVVIRLGDVFREAVACGAATIVLVHNHPSHDPTPSGDDVHLTREAAQAGKLLGIDVLDHIIVARDGYVSLRNAGLYQPDGAPTVQ